MLVEYKPINNILSCWPILVKLKRMYYLIFFILQILQRSLSKELSPLKTTLFKTEKSKLLTPNSFRVKFNYNIRASIFF
jgi:hypothetical protein